MGEEKNKVELTDTCWSLENIAAWPLSSKSVGEPHKVLHFKLDITENIQLYTSHVGQYNCNSILKISNLATAFSDHWFAIFSKNFSDRYEQQ